MTLLGICVPYLVLNDVGWRLLEVSIERIRRRTHGPYRLYGAVALRNPPDLAARLRAAGVVVPDIAPFEHPGIREHSYLLDMLADHAIADGCTHVASFDMDSWPVADGWDQLCREEVSAHTPLVAAVRTEIHANYPFPGFTFFRSDFWEPGRSSFCANLRAQLPDEVVRQVTRPTETGGGILAHLLHQGKSWVQLPRSNVWNPHPVMCGVYGDRIFHVAAGSRSPKFESDHAEYLLNDSDLRERFRTAMNTAMMDFLLDEVFEREDAFIEELRAPSPFDHLTRIALERDMKGMRQRVHQIGRRNERLRARVDAIESSLSWRITAPLRRVMQRLSGRP